MFILRNYAILTGIVATATVTSKGTAPGRDD